jgi:predicted secreted protein
MSQSNVTVEADADFSVRLESSATAGYVWQYDALPGALEPLGDSIEQAPGPQRAGGPATHVFRFRPNQKGRFTIRFVLKRPWEAEPVRVHTVAVAVD